MTGKDDHDIIVVQYFYNSGDDKLEDYVLRTINVSKMFKKNLVLNNLSLNIRKGEIYGFIGPNGAGKTTAMKIILGLLTASGGEVELFGTVGDTKQLKRVGSLIESPGLFTDCTAAENMKRFSILGGGTEAEAQNLLRLVGLADVGKKKVKSFSLGMKQRLGIAVSLIGKPELMILDEPVNGLDPMGMKDVRDIILNINKEMGVTFFISSHLLGELEKISTIYGIINKGVLVEEITSAELDTRCTKSLRFRCSEPKKAAEILQEKFSAKNYNIDGDVLNIDADVNRSAMMNRELVNSGIWVSELRVNNVSYEDYFLSRMGSMDVGNGVGQYV